MLSWLVSPGYLEKKVEGEFLLLLTKFDPKSLCPFCEVVQIPQSKHCFACNKCIIDFDHHCYWLNNCIGKHNHWIYLAFLFLTNALFITLLLTTVLSKSNPYHFYHSSLYRLVISRWYYSPILSP